MTPPPVYHYMFPCKLDIETMKKNSYINLQWLCKNESLTKEFHMLIVICTFWQCVQVFTATPHRNVRKLVNIAIHKLPVARGYSWRPLSGRVKWHHSVFGFHDLWLSADMLYSWVMEEKGLVNTHTHTHALACRGHDELKPQARMQNKSVNRRCSISKLMSLYTFSSVCTARASTTKHHSAPPTCLTKLLLSCLFAGHLTWRVLFVCFMTSEWTLSRVGLLPGERRVAHLAFLYLSWLGNWVCAEINRYFLGLAQQGVCSFHPSWKQKPQAPCVWLCLHACTCAFVYEQTAWKSEAPEGKLKGAFQQIWISGCLHTPSLPALSNTPQHTPGCTHNIKSCPRLQSVSLSIMGSFCWWEEGKKCCWVEEKGDRCGVWDMEGEKV